MWIFERLQRTLVMVASSVNTGDRSGGQRGRPPVGRPRSFRMRDSLATACGHMTAPGRSPIRALLDLGRSAAIAAAIVGLLIPVEVRAAARDRDPVRMEMAPRRAAVADGRLSDRSAVAGNVIDRHGRAVAEIPIVVLRGGQSVGSGTTRPDGTFAVAGLRGGVHQLLVGGHHYPIRLWTAKAAPPAAISRVVLVRVSDTVRGQLEPGPIGRGYERVKYWLADPLVVAGIITAAVAIPIAVHNANIDRDSGS